MTNSISSSNRPSVTSLATSVFGNAREAMKAIADAATSPSAESPAATAETAAKKGRRGVSLDRYA
ncbi:hypothetical protein [Actinoplanes utahensis]|uniref:Uncharacterized protein n=1 Tax=Actinoplanes utahensis TaxID=1869 RepID=A0A0A6U7U3_ACTUT|nr:hypothetical protein [Actinoplanes utahensis]KHD72125.1 hypothetical protein MB27_41460 [Actinoplanes utahensis]GIF27639.1 hypothetical protein Aut01nite_06250 [Actinoplanes utahensis]